MKILAKSVKGAEYMYKPMTAHKVSARSGQLIADKLNELRYELNDNEVWYMHEVDEYDTAYEVAQYQRFSSYRGGITKHGRWA